MSAVKESHMPTPEITSIQNQGHCLHICICDTLIDLMCILKLKLHFSQIFPKKFKQHYVIKANCLFLDNFFCICKFTHTNHYQLHVSLVFLHIKHDFFFILETCYFMLLYFYLYPIFSDVEGDSYYYVLKKIFPTKLF